MTTQVSVIGGDGLTGGGTMAALRTLNIGEGTGVIVNAAMILLVACRDQTDNVTFNNISGSNLLITGSSSVQH